MSTLAWPAPGAGSHMPGWLAHLAARWGRPWAELRIDVALPTPDLTRQLERLHQRLRRDGGGDGLRDCMRIPGGPPGFALHLRECGSEMFVYVEDVAQRRLAGFTAFQPPPDVAGAAQALLRSPHSRYAPAYQGRGLATSVYEWALDAGMCLLTGPRQSPAAHRLWRRLARAGHPLTHASVRGGVVHLLGPDVPQAVLEDFHTRLLLLGCGREAWTHARGPFPPPA